MSLWLTGLAAEPAQLLPARLQMPFTLMFHIVLVPADQDADHLLERLLRVASPLGLYAEEFDVDTGRIILAERLEEIS